LSSPDPSIPLVGYRRALRFASPYWPQLLLVLLSGIAATLFGLAQPYISKLLIDEALLKRNFDKLLLVSGLMLAATLLNFALNIISSYRYVKTSASILFDIRLALYRHLHTLSPRFWAGRRMGDVVSRINNDVAEVQRVSADSLLSILSNVVFLAGSGIIMASLNARLFLLSVAVLPVSVWALRRFQARLADRVRAVRESSAEIGSFLLETLLGVRVVAASGAQDRESARFRVRNNKFVDALLRMQVASFLAGAVPGVLLTVCTAALFLYGGKLVVDGRLTTGALVAMMAYHGRLLAPIQNLMSLYTNLISGGVSLSRVWELFDTPADVAEKPHAHSLNRALGAIEVDNISFAHDGTEIFSRLSFQVPPGRICAILGPSGAGKSTLADLLVRFHDPSAGVIRLDGHDLRDLRLADLRREVMLVDQAPYLFQATVRENILYARPEASEADLIDAARAAAIHDRILQLPQGYDTPLGERGQTLSAGERQRIALARALLANPRVLVLDEPTSALDEANEQAIADTLRNALAGRTVILITHRATLARIADQTITLSQGELVVA
jgi:ATP-binding cassette subfamily B protein